MASDPYRYFRVEARELANGLVQGVLELEKGSLEPEVVSRLLRLAHTLKGAARVVRQLEMAECAHQIEEVLAPLRDAARGIEPSETRALLGLVDQIEAQVAALTGEKAPVTAPEPAAVRRAPADDVFQTVRVDVEEMDQLYRAVTETGVQVAALQRELFELRRLGGISSALASRLSFRSRTDSRVVETTELGLALDLQGGLERAVARLGDRTERIGQELGDVREGVDRLRLIPVHALEGVLARAVRDAGQILGKSVRFKLEGGALRLDAQMLGPLRDAFLHLVRNAVAHGIEPPGERDRSGKPPMGLVELTVARKGGEVVFVCADDGRGIDEQAVRRELVARGALTASQSEELSRSDVLGRLLSGGLTTSSEVTQISGRGIGLDVVRETSARLKGHLSLESDAGRGTRVTLRFPFSLASLRALVVETSGVTVAIPLEAVRESRRLGPSDFRRSEGGDSVVCGDRVLSFLPLARALGRDDRATSRSSTSAVILEVAGVAAAIGVDVLHGALDVVVKPLPRNVAIDPVVSGLSLGPEGDPRLVLDPVQLLASALRERPSSIDRPIDRLPILVIDDSLTTRMLEQSILESAGYEVELAVSAEQGLEKARLRQFSVFLVDVEMPGMDGFEFVSITRADPDLGSTPAVLITSRNDPEDLERGRRAGASDYIVKGEFDQKRLLSTIERLLAR